MYFYIFVSCNPELAVVCLWHGIVIPLSNALELCSLNCSLGFASGFVGGLDNLNVLFMQSDGGLTSAERYVLLG